MNKTIRNFAILGALTSLFLAPSVVAQGDNSSNSIRAGRLVGLDQRLTAIEQNFASISKVKSSPDGDALSTRFGSQQLEYANGMLAEYDAALKQADLASKSGGRQGSIEALNQFEQVAKAHEARLRILDNRAKRVIENRGAATAWTPFTGAQLAWIDTRIDSVAKSLTPEAKALIALNVYNACKNNGQSQTCIQAVAKGLVDGNNARNTFNSCWNNASKPFRDLKRAACTVALVARLA